MLLARHAEARGGFSLDGLAKQIGMRSPGGDGTASTSIAADGRQPFAAFQAGLEAKIGGRAAAVAMTLACELRFELLLGLADVVEAAAAQLRQAAGPAPDLRQPCLLSKNCSSSVEPLSAAVEASRSIVVVTASK